MLHDLNLADHLIFVETVRSPSMDWRLQLLLLTRTGPATARKMCISITPAKRIAGSPNKHSVLLNGARECLVPRQRLTFGAAS